jgi:hypothetical protein
MILGIDLNQIFTFPFKDAEARKYFLIGCAVVLAGFVVPVIPYLVLFGYTARIAKQIFNDEAPRMIAWDDWSDMLKDGARMFGVRIIYALPILIPALSIVTLSIALLFVTDNASSSNVDTVINIFALSMFSLTCLIMLVSLPLALIIPAAEMHAVEKAKFAAGFRIREWWSIFRANLGGFVAAFAIYAVASMILTIALQIIMATLILSCLLPILLPAMTMYLTLVMYATIAQAYKGGKEKLAQAEIAQAVVA